MPQPNLFSLLSVQGLISPKGIPRGKTPCGKDGGEGPEGPELFSSLLGMVTGRGNGAPPGGELHSGLGRAGLRLVRKGKGAEIRLLSERGRKGYPPEPDRSRGEGKRAETSRGQGKFHPPLLGVFMEPGNEKTPVTAGAGQEAHKPRSGQDPRGQVKHTAARRENPLDGNEKVRVTGAAVDAHENTRHAHAKKGTGSQSLANAPSPGKARKHVRISRGRLQKRQPASEGHPSRPDTAHLRAGIHPGKQTAHAGAGQEAHKPRSGQMPPITPAKSGKGRGQDPPGQIEHTAPHRKTPLEGNKKAHVTGVTVDVHQKKRPAHGKMGNASQFPAKAAAHRKAGKSNLAGLGPHLHRHVQNPVQETDTPRTEEARVRPTRLAAEEPGHMAEKGTAQRTTEAETSASLKKTEAGEVTGTRQKPLPFFQNTFRRGEKRNLARADREEPVKGLKKDICETSPSKAYPPLRAREANVQKGPQAQWTVPDGGDRPYGLDRIQRGKERVKGSDPKRVRSKSRNRTAKQDGKMGTGQVRDEISIPKQIGKAEAGNGEAQNFPQRGGVSQVRAAVPPTKIHERMTARKGVQADNLKDLVKRAVLNLKKGRSELKIHLKPESLGQLKLRIGADNHQVTVRIVAETHQAKEMIESNLNQLKAGFHGQGLVVEKFDVSVDQGQKGQGTTYDMSQSHGRGENGSGRRDGGGGQGRQHEDPGEPGHFWRQGFGKGSVNFFA